MRTRVFTECMCVKRCVCACVCVNVCARVGAHRCAEVCVHLGACVCAEAQVCENVCSCVYTSEHVRSRPCDWVCVRNIWSEKQETRSKASWTDSDDKIDRQIYECTLVVRARVQVFISLFVNSCKVVSPSALLYPTWATNTNISS